MENHGQDLKSHSDQRNNHGPVRSRWTPKHEQILILESIFNSGMVNPPKDETVRIRKLLEKFGTVGDANVFYWFQNRRSRSRRRQRQMQATLSETDPRNNISGSSNSHHNCGSHSNSSQLMSGAMTQNLGGSSSSGGYAPLLSASTSNYPHQCSSPNDYHVMASSNFYGGGLGIGHEVAAVNFFPVPTQMGYTNSDTNSILCPSDTSNLNYPSGYITVFINGVPTELPRGPIDMKVVFGENAMLVHSSGVPVPVNDFGFLMQILEHGESYFLVSRPT